MASKILVYSIIKKEKSMKITLISDTHSKHKQLDGDLPGGEILIHAGDFMFEWDQANNEINF